MKHRAGIIPSPYRFSVAAAALAFVAFGGSAVQAAQQVSQPAAATANPNHCTLVKSAAARSACEASRVQFYNGNYVAALVIVRNAINVFPKEGILRAMAAGIMNQLGNVGPAERELRQARKDGAPDHLVLPALFNVMIARHEEVALLNEFPEPSSTTKGDAASDILQGRALALLSMGQLAEAGAAVDRSLSLNRDADGLLLRAKIATKQNDSKLARDLVDEAYRIAPNQNPVLLAKLGQLELSGDTTGVLTLSDQMLRIYPLSTQCRVYRIRAYLKLNQDAMAKREVDAILVRRSKSPDGLFYKAVLLTRAHDKKGAAQALLSLPVQFVKTNPQYAVQMAQIAFDADNPGQAASILSAALSANPDQLDVRLRLADLRLSQNSPLSAQLLLGPVKDSTDQRVQKLLAQVRTKIAKDRAF